jgi:ComF family protein
MIQVQTILRSALNFALPSRCPSCGQIVARDHQLCVLCWQSLEFLTDVGCVRCGDTVSYSGQICAPCLANPPDHDGVRAAVAYGDIARTLVLRFKYGGRTGLARIIADAMLRNLDERDALIIPVPLHRWRIWGRGFNQSALIAKHLAALSGNSLCLSGLIRTRRTPPLRGLGAKARAEMVCGVFAVSATKRSLLTGKTVYLIDDVYTSGATTNACAKALKRAGATNIIILCWARVMRDNAERD